MTSSRCATLASDHFCTRGRLMPSTAGHSRADAGDGGVGGGAGGARVVSVGNAVVDLLLHVDQLPRSGDDVTALESGTAVGGSVNTLVAARRQGRAAVYAGAHGTGPFGDLVRAELQRADIGVAHAPVPGIDTGWDVAIVEAGGERTFLTTVGAEASLTLEALARVVLEPGDLVHVSGYGLAREPSGSALAAWLPTLDDGVIVLLDPGPLVADLPAELLDPVLTRVDWWSGNEREALAATGAADAEAAARALTGRVRCGVVVRRGASGCLLSLVGQGAVESVPGFAVDAIDTNGAGDAHVGVFLAALASGFGPREAARRANAAAALAVTRRGPATAPTARELEEFLAGR